MHLLVLGKELRGAEVDELDSEGVLVTDQYVFRLQISVTDLLSMAIGDS